MNEFQQIFEEKFLEIRQRSPAFSQRAFAKRLGLSSGAISEILRRKRKISPKLAQSLAKKMEFSPQECKRAGLPTNKEEKEFELSLDTFHLVADWWHYGILNLTKVTGFRSNSGWIAARLGISKQKAEEAIERLLRVGLLVKDSKGRLGRTHARLKTSDNVTNLAVQRSHRESLGLAVDALDRLPVHQRDLTSCTFALDPAQLARLGQMVRVFQDEIMAEATTTAPKEVFRMAIQIFPLSKIEHD